jgi:hypothetical protein
MEKVGKTMQDILDALRERSRADILRTPAPGCPACERKAMHHTTEILRYHVFAGHGRVNNVYTHPALEAFDGRTKTAPTTASAARPASGTAGAAATSPTAATGPGAAKRAAR